MKVINTIIKNNNDNGIVSEGASRNIIIDNVTIEQAQSTTPPALQGAGIHFFGTSGSTIKNSLISNNDADGILFEGEFSAPNAPASNNSVVGNTIANNTPNGVALAVGSASNAVVNNIFTGNANAILDNGSGNVTTPNILV